MGRSLARNALLWAAIAYLVLLVIAAVFAPWVAPDDPEQVNFSDNLLGQSWDHLLGADAFGRDTFSRVVYGARTALLAAVEATAIGVALGVPLGLIIGYRGGWLDRIVMRVIDGLNAIPGIVLAIALIAAFGTGLTRSMLAVGVLFATVMARITRGQVLSERERDYVDGARVAGVNERAVLFRHVLPNVAPAVIVQATLMFSTAISVEAGLSFVGLGVQSPDVSWGIMLADAADVVALDAFQAVPPGMAIFLTVLAINLVGDHLQSLVIGGQSGATGTVLDPAPVTARADGSASPAVTDGQPTLAVQGLSVSYGTPAGPVTAVDGATLHVDAGEVLAVVGESGCGKSSLGLGIAGLLAPPAQLRADHLRIRVDVSETDLVNGDDRARRRWRDLVGLVFQEPSASLNPLNTIGRQLTRAIRSRGVSKADARTRALELLAQVQIPDPAKTFAAYPHQISGGMAQRVMIALALAQDPSVLIADEPTTALDVTVQAEVLSILRDLCRDLDLAVILITHDLGVVADLADRTAVMYAGQVIEIGPVEAIAGSPLHPYTAALASAVPRNEPGFGIPDALGGTVPSPGDWPAGCRFADRCPHAVDRCSSDPVPLEAATADRSVACIRADELSLAGIPVDVAS